ncbi:hypothetical protein D3C86_1245090 [compost metagenome]
MAGHEHRTAVEVGRGLGGGAPEQAAGEARRVAGGVEMPAHGRVDAVGAHQHVRFGLDGGAVAAAPQHEARRLARPAAAHRGDGFDCMAGMNAVRAQALHCRLVQQHLELPAMHRELRPGVAGGHAARLVPDLLAKLVVVGEGGCLDGDLGQRVLQPQRGEFPHRMGQQVDADAKRADLLAGFPDFHIHAVPVAEQGERQPANAAAGDGDLRGLHGLLRGLLSGLVPGVLRRLPLSAMPKLLWSITKWLAGPGCQIARVYPGGGGAVGGASACAQRLPSSQ